MLGKMKILAGNSNQPLAEAIAAYLSNTPEAAPTSAALSYAQ